MKELQDLRRACLAGGSHPVVLTKGTVVTASDLRERALAVAAAIAARPEERWAVWLRGPGDFLAVFLGLALAGKALVLPGNMQKGTAELLAPHFDGLISDESFGVLDRPQLTTADFPAAPAAFQPRLEGDIAVVLFTSGSTGEPKAIAKTLRLFERELTMQQQQWGSLVGQLPVIATVSHQHIYGLLHAVLWPFLRAAPFVDQVCQYPEELAARAEEYTATVLVSSPTHLVRLPESPAMTAAVGKIRASFSSGGPLPEEAALAVRELLGRAPFEILGSTETGGVAWRQQGKDDAWTPLPQVEVTRDQQTGCLAVSAPHLGEPQPYVMGDQVELRPDGRFQLLGRADRVVKVEGKRLSITEMERRLEASPWVAEARLAVVRGKREEVGAVVVLSAEGRDRMERQGKLALNRALRDWLLVWFERPLLPRRWRYLARLPYNAQGKITAADLTAILQREAQ